MRFCLERLNAAEKAVQLLMVGENGSLVLKAANLEDTAGEPPDA